MKYGLSDSEITDIRSVFSNFPQVDQAILYGSRAKGNYKNGSDIDIVLKGTSLNLSLLATINSQLDDLIIPYKVDLFLFEKIKNKELINHINRVGQNIFVRS
jgi:predicted nucleotidyltransferase